MIDYHKEVQSALQKILPSYHEGALVSTVKTPCISYMEVTNIDDKVGNTLGYSFITFQIKVWSTSIKDLESYSLKVDKTMRALGFKRISSAELHDKNSTMKQKILGYEILGLENY